MDCPNNLEYDFVARSEKERRQIPHKFDENTASRPSGRMDNAIYNTTRKLFLIRQIIVNQVLVRVTPNGLGIDTKRKWDLEWILIHNTEGQHHGDRPFTV